MFRKVVWLIYFLISFYRLAAQILPKEGSVLNYRVIGFTFPPVVGVNSYKVEIASGNCDNEKMFTKNIIASYSGKNNKIICKVPFFGKQYTWRCVLTKDSFQNNVQGETGMKSDLHHFSTMAASFLEESSSRMRIMKDATKYKDAYFFLDATKSLYDMQGNLVWFLPDSLTDIFEPIEMARDIKLSPQGTITFLVGSDIYEINYSGDVLWRGPANKIVENGSTKQKSQYHNELTRLLNGHYMVLATEHVLCKMSDSKDGIAFKYGVDGEKQTNDTSYKDFPLGTLIEYDESGHIAWKWEMAKYIPQSDLLSWIKTNGFERSKLHDNAFYFDEKNSAVYLSITSLNRVLKLKYPDGDVLNTYQGKYKTDLDAKGVSLFCRQHACGVSEKGFLYLYNNNDCNAPALPNLVMMIEPTMHNDTLREIWRYECRIDGDSIKQKIPALTHGGGNVVELPDNSLFVCMGNDYGKLFIVNFNKEILWSALPEKWNSDKLEWDVLPSYRASIIWSNSLFEKMVWGGSISAQSRNIK